ncbi:MAG TPA: hypothetical protein VFV83_04525, partial [Chthoniobacteraceae bacterium]|nr:hypothetical protein [Chthoniobacteraceae bacterium]
MNWRIPRLFRIRRGRAPEARAWPWLVLFAAAVAVGIGCVFWFMREAMRNERMAERQRLADAYRSHVALLQTYLAEAARTGAAQLDGNEPPPVWFLACVQSQRASSAIIRNSAGAILYPIDTIDAEPSAKAQQLQADARALVTAGKADEAIDLIVSTTAAPEFGDAFDAQGRLVAASLELFAAQLMKSAEHPQFGGVARRLTQRANDYAHVRMPSSQRRFVMRELQRLAPASTHFPTLAAEDYAAHYLEAGTVAKASGFQRTGLAGLWQLVSSSGNVIGLFTTEELRKRFDAVLKGAPQLGGARVDLVAPGEERMAHQAALVSVP